VAYVTDVEVKTYFAAHLGVDNTALDARYDVLIPRANTAAYNQIRSKLLERGFTLTQIDDWDQGEEFNLDLACCYLLRTGHQTAESDLWQQKFCRQAELETVTILVDGEVITPSATVTGVGYGDMINDNDQFGRDTKW
jgi:hypothetical protein